MGLEYLGPFPIDRYPKEQRDAAAALWRWYRARFRGNEASLEALESILSRHGASAEGLRDVAESLGPGRSGPESGADVAGHLDRLVGPVAQKLGSLAGYTRSWQLEGARRLAHGMLLLDHLAHVPEYARSGVVLFPRTEMAYAGITVGDLAGSVPPAKYRRLAWKQGIRARDALAGGRELLGEMPLRHRLFCRRQWLIALEYLHELDRRDFDVWNRPLSLNPAARARVYIQSIFGQTAFR